MKKRIRGKTENAGQKKLNPALQAKNCRAAGAAVRSESAAQAATASLISMVPICIPACASMLISLSTLNS